MEAVVKQKSYRNAHRTTRGFISFYTKGEEIFNAVSHIVGGALGIVFWAVCLLCSPSVTEKIAVSVFGVSIVILYTMSALYHFLPNGTAKGVFRIFDHCTIFLLIAGTFTPYCLIPLAGTLLGNVILAVEWICAAAGITMNAIAMNHRAIKIISMVLYFVMGWMALLFFPQLAGTVSAACLWLLLCGGIAYTGGIVFFALGKKVRYFHSVWHLFDLVGTILQFLSVLMLLG